MNMQPQRVPLGSFRAPNGAEVLVTIRREWFGLLQELVDAAGGDSSGGGDADDGGFELAPPMVSVAPRSDLQSPDVAPISVNAATISGLLARVQALESDSVLQRLQAEISSLQARIKQLEEA